MEHRTLVKLAATTLALGLTTVGCTATNGGRLQSASTSGTPDERAAGKASGAAMSALGEGNVANAVTQAELAVSLSPRDAGFRRTLGDIYLKAGRFQSAAAAYADSVQLNPGDSKSVLSLALAQIGLGRNADAIATLGAVTGNVAPADHGLALALAGDKEGAIRLLGAAAREPNANGRVRQNLALAYALAGDWTQARAIAAQDVDASELDARMEKWAAFAQPRDSYDQVATLLGVSPVADAGQPAPLALNVGTAPVQVATVAPSAALAEVAAFAQAAPAEAIAVAEAQPVEVVAGAETMPRPEPVLAAAIASVETVLPRQMSRPVARTLRAAASAPATFKGRYVVQIGAFASARSVESAWNGAVGRLDRLANYFPASTRFTVGDGSTLTRLSFGGFAQRQTADALCASLKRRGGTCFVRTTAGDAPTRWASRRARNG